MYSLFWKIFLTFWVTILAIELLTAWFTADLSESEIHPILEKHNEEFVVSSTNAVSVLTKKGLTGFREWAETKDNLKGIDEVYIFDKNRGEVNRKEIPPNIRMVLDNEFNRQSFAHHYQPIKHLLTFKTTTQDGDEYSVVSTFLHPPLLKYLLVPQRVAVSVIISGLLCFFLARYFTSPLTNLRRSTQRMTRGDFDTTSLKRLRSRKDEFGALAIDFNAMTVRLSKVLDNQRQLLRDISHELNSPLSRIRVAIELARSRYAANDSKELDRIETEIERLELLINELLTFVKIESSNKKESMVRIDVREMLEHIVDDAQYVRSGPDIQQHISLHCRDGLEVLGDSRLLNRAIDNIVRNACYYSPPHAAINVRCANDSDNAYIFIEDQGPGVPDKMLEQIFDPFVRVSSARESDTGGSGIGLAIAKKVVEMHKGTIKAKNKDNEGLIVAISLPLYSHSISQSAA